MREKVIARIVTFHCVPNYGAVLQSYALQQKLLEYFEDVSILDYQPKKLLKEYNVINTYSYKSILLSLYSANSFLKKKKKFRDFMQKYYHLTDKKYTCPDTILDCANYYFLGSDQIWNPEITGGFDKTYFAGFDKKQKSRSISYAASLGKGKFSEDEIAILSELIHNIDGISVREDEARQIIEEQCNCQAEVVVDPTLLLRKEQWECLIKKQSRAGYVLLYSLNGYGETEILAEKVSRYFDLKLVEISGRRKPLVKKNHEAIYTAGPEEFLSLIHDANFIVTDSFHGTVFSILFHRPFFTVPHKTRGGRITNLLTRLGLMERTTIVFDKDKVRTEIDWKDVDQRLIQERKKSINFIETQIGR